MRKKYQRLQKREGARKTRKLVKREKNTLFDTEWIWRQLENDVSTDELFEKIEEKYELKEHGNKGRKHKKHKNPWIKRRKNGN